MLVLDFPWLQAPCPAGLQAALGAASWEAQSRLSRAQGNHWSSGTCIITCARFLLPLSTERTCGSLLARMRPGICSNSMCAARERLRFEIDLACLLSALC